MDNRIKIGDIVGFEETRHSKVDDSSFIETRRWILGQVTSIQKDVFYLKILVNKRLGIDHIVKRFKELTKIEHQEKLQHLLYSLSLAEYIKKDYELKIQSKVYEITKKLDEENNAEFFKLFKERDDNNDKP